LKLRKIVKTHVMLAKAGIHYAKIKEKMDSHFLPKECLRQWEWKIGNFFC